MTRQSNNPPGWLSKPKLPFGNLLLLNPLRHLKNGYRKGNGRRPHPPPTCLKTQKKRRTSRRLQPLCRSRRSQHKKLCILPTLLLNIPSAQEIVHSPNPPSQHTQRTKQTLKSLLKNPVHKKAPTDEPSQQQQNPQKGRRPKRAPAAANCAHA
jgi:hypothetical protein